jgi:hypothetical protein
MHHIFDNKIMDTRVLGGPRIILQRAISNLASGITKLNLPGANCTDEMLATIAASPAAKSLLVLDLSTNLLTDESASCWSSFQALEDLNLSNTLITRTTLKILARMPNLQKFSLAMGTRCSLYPDGLVFFQPDAAPQLRSIRFPGSWWQPSSDIDKFFQELIACLDQRPNLDLIEEILFGSRQYKAAYARVLELLPNLQRPPFFFSDWNQLESLDPAITSNLIHLEFRKGTDPFTPAALAALRSRFPNLRQLRIEDSDFHIRYGEETFENFSSLQKLRMSYCDSAPYIRLPQSLRFLRLNNLDVSPAGMHYPPTEEEEVENDPQTHSLRSAEFVQNLIRDVPQLERLEISQSFHFDGTMLQQIRDSFPNAVKCNVSGKSKSPIKVRHPNLASIRIDESFDDYAIAFERAPSLKVAYMCCNPIGDTPLFGPKSLSRRTTPNLARLQVSFVDGIKAEATDREEAIESILSLQSLEHLDSDGVIDVSDFVRLPAVSRLQSLRLEATDPIDFIPNIAVFRNLRSLTLCECDVSNLSTVRLPWLQKLSLSHVYMMQPLHFDPSLVPSIEEMALLDVSPPALSIVNLINLIHLDISSIAAVADLTIRGCPNLTYLLLKSLSNCDSVCVTDNLRLRILSLRRTQFTPQSEIIISCPSLEDLTLEATADVSRFMMSLCDRLVDEAGANLRQYSCDAEEPPEEGDGDADREDGHQNGSTGEE